MLQRFLSADTKYQQPSIGSNGNNCSTQITMLAKCSPAMLRASECQERLSVIWGARLQWTDVPFPLILHHACMVSRYSLNGPHRVWSDFQTHIIPLWCNAVVIHSVKVDKPQRAILTCAEWGLEDLIGGGYLPRAQRYSLKANKLIPTGVCCALRKMSQAEVVASDIRLCCRRTSAWSGVSESPAGRLCVRACQCFPSHVGQGMNKDKPLSAWWRLLFYEQVCCARRRRPLNLMTPPLLQGCANDVNQDHQVATENHSKTLATY